MQTLLKNKFFLQSFIWPLARCATPEEQITVELRSQTTKILLKTGLATTSTSRGGSSRGAISSNSKMVGRYVMLMQGNKHNVYSNIYVFFFFSFNPVCTRLPLFYSLTNAR